MRRFMALTVVLVAAALLAGCSGSASDSREILLEVTGTGPTSVYYGDGNEPSISPPWHKTLRERRGTPVSVVATALQPDQTVTCRITVAGRKIMEQTAAIAKCDYTVK